MVDARREGEQGGGPPAGDPEFVVVGRVGRPHGVRGQLFVRSLTDRPEATFSPGTTLLPADAGGSRPDPGERPLAVAASRPYRDGLLLRFEGIGDRDQADGLRGRYLLRAFSETEPLGEGEVFQHQLVGLAVVTPDGRSVGRVREVYDLRPAVLLEVAGAEGEHLIPFTGEFLVALSLEEGTLVIDPPEGLLDL